MTLLRADLLKLNRGSCSLPGANDGTYTHYFELYIALIFIYLRMLGHSAAVAATAPATNPSNPRPSSVLTFTFIQTHLLSMEKPDFRAKLCHPLR